MTRRLLFVVLFPSLLLFPQSKRPALRPTALLRTSAALSRTVLPLQDSVRILAVMVQFQTDDDDQTSGDGTFQTQYVSGLLDPPPHDRSYFTNKLTFLQNYFRKVSNGQVTVTGTVLPQVVTLPHVMEYYAPAANDGTNKWLALLAMDSWHAVDSISPGFDFSKYDAFTVFHAGVGKDLNLVAELGYDPTPYDIPSLYLGLQAFRDGLGDQSFNGIPVDSGAFKITNTIIMPETETRVIVESGFNDTLKLAMNGLAAASLGSYLGLPDLFNTTAGLAGIGQFGLMDIASIFAYGGIFPPEPSAWEKIYLGWVKPIVVTSSGTITLPAVSLTTTGQDSIYKIPISGTEYFLVENRNRDPLNNGQHLTIVENHITRLVTFPTDSLDFFSYNNVSAVTGSVIDVDDYDWALIGRIDSTHLYDGGGILIWHIDEGVINANLATNTVNGDMNHRGVNLEEADGSQDIGQVYTQTDAGYGTEYGSPLDCWFQGNSAFGYTNSFDQHSIPSSNANSGARSLVAIRNFSPRSPRMTAMVQFGSEGVKPVPGFPKILGGQVPSALAADLDGDGVPEIVAARSGLTGAKGSIIAWRQDGTNYLGADSAGVVAWTDSIAVGGLAVLDHPAAGKRYIAAAAPDGVYEWRVEDLDNDKLLDRVFKLPSVQGSFTMFADTFVVAFGGPTVSVLSLQGTVLYQFPSSPGSDVCRVGATDLIAVAGGDSLSLVNFRTGAVMARNILTGTIHGLVCGDMKGDGSVVIGMTTEESYDAAASHKHLYLFDSNGGLILRSDELDRHLAPDETLHNLPALADITGDGKKSFITVSNLGKIYAVNVGGYLVSGFPKTVPSAQIPPESAPVVADISGDSHADVVYVDGSGNLLEFPSAGGASPSTQILANGSTTPAFFPLAGTAGSTDLAMAAVDGNGTLNIFDLLQPYSAATTRWPMKRYDPSQSDFAAIATANPVPVSSAFLPKDRVYNWPNPVYGPTTQIRYYTSEDANISVRIYDLAGAKITELRGKSTAGIDGELTWDVSRIQSGVYLARVEADAGGQTGATIIKIAVVK